MEQKLIDRVQRAISEYAMLENVHGVLVGFSGGADSSALLRILKPICDERSIKLAALHIHHGIRGEEADRDANFCLRECEKLGIDCRVEYFDIPAISKELGKGIEETARICRYEAFVKAVRSNTEINCIATAHNADDNAETVIFNLARGCGTDGLCGIPPVRYEKEIKLIRPLIFCIKDDICQYLNRISAPFIFDSTNDDNAYRRNYIRHNIMPALCKLNPSFSDAAARTSNMLRDDAAFLEMETEHFLLLNAVNGVISVSALSAANRAIFSRAVIKLIGGATNAMPEYKHIEAIRALVKAGRNNTSVSVCSGVRAVIENGKLYFTEHSNQPQNAFIKNISSGVNQHTSPDFAILAAENGHSLSYLQKDNESLQNIYKLSIQIRLNFDKINGTLFVRSRREGDSYVFGGMTRKLKKLYNDRKYPIDVRRSIPVVCDRDGIIWVPGFPCADRVKSTKADDGGLVYYSNIGEAL